MRNLTFCVAIATLAGAVACSAPEPQPAAKPEAAAAPAPKASKPGGEDAVSRADAMIADLKKREEEQERIQKEVTGNVPVVVEVTPKTPAWQTIPRSGGGYVGGPPMPMDGRGADYWRQEFSIANARLMSSQQRLEAARRNLADAQSKSSGSNETLKKMGQDLYTRAQKEMQDAQTQYYADQNAVENARRYALSAGVPPNMLR